MSDRLVLNINNNAYEGWQDVNIRQSIMSICGTFGVSNIGFRPGVSGDLNIKIDDEVTVEIDEQRIITGYIDDMPVTYSFDGADIAVIGRDKTEDLIDCSFDESINEWKNQTITNIVKNLCSPYGINVSVDGAVADRANTRIETFKADEGDVVADLIIRLCRENSILPVSYGDGKLTLTEGTTTRKATDSIKLFVNTDQGYMPQSNRDRFSRYKVKGQGIGTDDKQLKDFVNPFGQASDNVVKRYRPTIIFSETPTDFKKCQNRAIWEARIRAAISRRIIYPVFGWTQSNGEIWEINTLVDVYDDFLGIKETKLITGVNFIFNSEDMDRVTNIEVMDKDAFSLNKDIRTETDYD